MLQQCPKADELLGDNIGAAYSGCTCGFTKVEGACGRVTWTLPMSGDTTRGICRFYLEQHVVPWQMLRAEREAGDRVLDVIVCRHLEGEE